MVHNFFHKYATVGAIVKRLPILCGSTYRSNFIVFTLLSPCLVLLTFTSTFQEVAL